PLSCPLPLRERAQWSAHELERVKGSRSTPPPVLARGNIELPSPARGEGAIMPTAFVALFTLQTAHLVPAAHVCDRRLHPCFAHPNRGVGGAPRDVRVRARHPLGVS